MTNGKSPIRTIQERNRRLLVSRNAAICAGLSLLALFFASLAFAQSGRSPAAGRKTTIIPVIAQRVEDPNKPKSLLSGDAKKAEENERIIPKQTLELFDGGVLQKIEAFAPDPSPSRYVILMDNSLTLQADIKKLSTVPAGFAPEIYEGDKVMVIGYDQKPEIITEFTDDPKALQGTLSLLRKNDTPRLFDSLNVVMEDVFRPEVGLSKRVVIIVGDGLDRESKIKFDEILAKLQNENVTVYAIQVRDRTRGALRRDAPKPADALKQLTEGTGGKTFPMDNEVKDSIKVICDEMRNDRYQLTYFPEGVNPINKRLLLLTATDATVTLRYKGWHPPIKQ